MHSSVCVLHCLLPLWFLLCNHQCPYRLFPFRFLFLSFLLYKQKLQMKKTTQNISMMFMLLSADVSVVHCENGQCNGLAWFIIYGMEWIVNGYGMFLDTAVAKFNNSRTSIFHVSFYFDFFLRRRHFVYCWFYIRRTLEIGFLYLPWTLFTNDVFLLFLFSYVFEKSSEASAKFQSAMIIWNKRHLFISFNTKCTPLFTSNFF